MRPSDPPAQSPLSLLAKVFIALFLGFVTLLIYNSEKPLISLQACFIGLLPSAVALFFVLHLSDEQLPKSFLVEQLFFGGVLAYLAALLIEFVLSIVGIETLFHNDIHKFMEKFMYLKHPNSTEKAKFITKALINLPHWKIVIFALFTAFVVAATTEETAKLIVAQRAKRLLPGGSRDCNLSAHSMVGAVAAGALGLAATEHLTTHIKLLSYFATVPIFATLMSLFRASLAFPVHIGTAILFGVAMAKKLVFHHQVRVLWPFLLAIMFHGTFDAIAMVSIPLVLVHAWPRWVLILVPVVQIVITITFVVACRKSYKSLNNSEYNGYQTVDDDMV